MSDKIAKAYIAMKRPKRFPSLQTSFGEHSKKQEEPPKEPESKEDDKKPLKEAIASSTTYVMDDKNYDDDHTDHIHESNKLHDDVDGLVEQYTHNSRDINSALHKHYNSDPHDRDQIEIAKKIEKALDKNVAKEHFHVYTGVHHSPFKNVATVGGNHMVHLPAFTSTSSHFRKAMIFTNRDDTTKHDPAVHSGHIEPMSNHVLKIHIHPGVSIASVRHIAKWKSENELIMNRGYDLRIDPVPTRVHHESDKPLYVWNAYPVERRGRNLNIDTGKDANQEPVRLGSKLQS